MQLLAALGLAFSGLLFGHSGAEAPVSSDKSNSFSHQTMVAPGQSPTFPRRPRRHPHPPGLAFPVCHDQQR